MLEVSRYIHLNPVKAKMVRREEHYPWSSFRLYKYSETIPPCFMNMESLLDYYKSKVNQTFV